MKKLNLSVVALLAAGSFAVAGGDIAPIEPVVDTPVVVPGNTGFYVGLAYGYMNETYSRTPQLDPKNFDDSLSTFMLQAGYQINDYVAVEGRYWYGRGSDLDVQNAAGTAYTLAGPNTFGMYVKPMYPVTDAIDVYALLGYAASDHNSVKLNYLDGFSWGIGGSYDVRENIALFVDYTSLYDDDHTVPGGLKSYTLDTWNFGITYKF